MDVPPASEDFGRQPPQDAAAEQAVLGGMLLSKDAIADVLERLRPGDFYRPAHQNVYDAILDLYGRGEPADDPAKQPVQHLAQGERPLNCLSKNASTRRWYSPLARFLRRSSIPPLSIESNSNCLGS